jgi:endonuclease III
MKKPTVDWAAAVKPLIKKYKAAKHPLEAQDLYQMLVEVVLSAQTTDALINSLAPALFKAVPTMAALAKIQPEDLHPYISKVRSFGNKSRWLVSIAQTLKKDSAIPLTMDGLVQLPGIGRKSANVIKRFAGAKAEGIVVDVHVIRVAPRLGIVKEDKPDKMEKEMMGILPESQWDAGMCMSFLGREICRPEPLCEKCLMKDVCAYYQHLKK